MSSPTITDVRAWEALDSRGRPTVGCVVELAGGVQGRVVVPSGASTGRHEAVELRDGGDRYAGWGVRGAVDSVRQVYRPLLLGRPVQDRTGIDALLEATDGDPGLARLGANAALAVSLGVTVADAAASGQPLWRRLDPTGRPPLIPMPMVNVFSGGAHAGRAIDLQDVLAVPLGAASFAEALEWVDRVRRRCAELVDAAGGWSALVADEGGLAARLPGNESALAMLTEAIERSGLVPGEQVGVAVDVAASQLYDGTEVVLAADRDRLSPAEWVRRWQVWVARYPVVSLEDPVGEDDWASWSLATRSLPGVQVLGDDLFATSLDRLRHGVEVRAAGAVLVKVNQAGTVSRAEQVLRHAQRVGMATVVSARSGDTEDHWLADLAVGWRAGQIKVGSLQRSERTAKWNRLLEIEATTGSEFASWPTPPASGVPTHPSGAEQPVPVPSHR